MDSTQSAAKMRAILRQARDHRHFPRVLAHGVISHRSWNRASIRMAEHAQSRCTAVRCAAPCCALRPAGWPAVRPSGVRLSEADRAGLRDATGDPRRALRRPLPVIKASGKTSVADAAATFAGHAGADPAALLARELRHACSASSKSSSNLQVENRDTCRHRWRTSATVHRSRDTRRGLVLGAWVEEAGRSRRPGRHPGDYLLSLQWRARA
ncbi:MAG: hypothetical protein MZU91_08460 [Desulfosudis oleivorans]|nr:hypothetical protein [Desulfosudis oleivorans]